jgi:hypothetical protein
MSTLQGKKIKDTFDGLIKTNNEDQLPGTGQVLLQDGNGNDSSLSLGRSGEGVSLNGNLDVTGRVDSSSQVRVEDSGSNPGLVLGSSSSSGTKIKLENTYEKDAFISLRGGNVGIGGVDGVSTNNLNIRKSDGYVGIKQKAPLAPLHVKKNGEAIRLESTGDNICSIDFRQGTNKRGHIEYDNSNDTLEIQTQNPTGATSKIKFSVAKQGQDPEEVMRIQSTAWGGKQVVIGNIPSVYSQRELFVSGDAEVTRDLWVGRNAEIDGRCHADSFKVEGLNTAPGSATADGKQGEIRYTADYIYVCVSENNWKRTALTSW